MITRAVGGLFFIKGFLCLLTAFKCFDDVYPLSIGANPWDFFMMLFTEIGPTFVFVILSNKKPSQQTPDEENETEMKNYENQE